jgi:hypothetical protein
VAVVVGLHHALCSVWNLVVAMLCRLWARLGAHWLKSSERNNQAGVIPRTDGWGRAAMVICSAVTVVAAVVLAVVGRLT